MTGTTPHCRDRDSVGRPSLFDDRGHSRAHRLGGCRLRSGSNAERKEGRPAPGRWGVLLLVLGRSLRDGYRARNRTVGPGLPPLHSWSARVSRCVPGAESSSRTVAQLGAVPYPWYGSLLCAYADGILCRQWKEPTALEPVAADRLLGAARRDQYPATWFAPCYGTRSRAAGHASSNSARVTLQ